MEKPTRIAEPLEILMDRYKAYNDKRLKQALMSMLYYHRLFQYYKRLSMQRKERVLVNQKLEVIDGTFQVWDYIRTSLVDWLLEVFVRSADRAQQRKM